MHQGRAARGRRQEPTPRASRRETRQPWPCLLPSAAEPGRPADAVGRRAIPLGSSTRSRRKQTKPAALRLEIVRILRQVLGAVLRHEHEVFEPHAAEALAVAARLDGDDVARAQRLLGSEAHPRRLVHLEPDPMAEAVEEALVERLSLHLRPLRLLARRLEDLARAVEDGPAVGSIPDLGKGAVESLLAESMPGANLIGDVADDERAGHVAVTERLVVAGPDVDHDRHPGSDRPGPHVVPDRTLRPRGDDEF